MLAATAHRARARASRCSRSTSRPRRAPQRRAAAAAAAARRSRAAPASGSRSCSCSLLIAGGAFAYQAISGASDKQVQLNEEVGGSVDDAVQSFKDLVDDNTR